MIRATVKKYAVTGKVVAFALTVAVVLRTVISAAISSPFLIHGTVSHPWQVHALVKDVAPPITAGGFLYDRTTGAVLFDAVTGAAIIA